MKQTDAAKKIVGLWPEWPNAVGENLSDDALRFVGWLRLRHPEVLSFRSAQTKLELIVDWLSADKAITDSYRHGELLSEREPIPAQPNAVNGSPNVIPLRKNSGASSVAPKSKKASSGKKAKSSSARAKAKGTTSAKKAKAGSPAKKSKATASRAKSKAKSSSAKSTKPAKASSRSKSKKGASAAGAAKRGGRKPRAQTRPASRA